MSYLPKQQVKRTSQRHIKRPPLLKHNLSISKLKFCSSPILKDRKHNRKSEADLKPEA